MADEIAEAEAYLAECKLNLAAAEATLEIDPNNAEALGQKDAFVEAIAEVQALLESLTGAQAQVDEATPAAAVTPPVPETAAEVKSAPKTTTSSVTSPPAISTVTSLPTGTDSESVPAPPPPDSENVPSPRAETSAQSPEPASAQPEAKRPPVVYHFNPGDTVLARWAEDHKMYLSTVISKTGSSANPIYYVKYNDYGDYAQVSGKDIRPTYQAANAAAKKRKAEEELSKTSAQPSTSSSAVISAGPTYYDKQDDSAAKKAKGDEKPKGTASKIYKQMDSKGLEKHRSSWEEWNTKSKWAKKNKKESMFSVGDSHKARVGFVGSGREMTKDAPRKHGYNKDNVKEMKKNYQPEE